MAEEYDALVVGAGPAGSVSAIGLARRDWRVLLIDRAPVGRDKVCGGCLSPHAVSLLGTMRLQHVLRDATPLHGCDLRSGSSRAGVPSGGVAIARRELDARLIDAAIDAGVEFRADTSAKLESLISERRVVRIRHLNAVRNVHARVVLACDGINGSLLNGEPWAAWRVSPRSHMGVSFSLPATMPITGGRIVMHVGRHGYVGIVRYSDHTLHVAAALSPSAVKDAGDPRVVAQAILTDSGSPIDLGDAKPLGCGLLTRRRDTLGGDRVLCVGDACGYVEPFTGEGVAWALRGAVEITTLLKDGWHDALPALWTRHHRRTIGRVQRRCRVLRWGLRSPGLTAAAMKVARVWPSVAARLAPPPAIERVPA